MNLYQVAQDLIRRLTGIFVRDGNGLRPVYGGTRTFQEDPHWRDLLQFFEYFHGDNGAGLGASHQTGWTGVIAALMHLSTLTAERGSSRRPRACLRPCPWARARRTRASGRRPLARIPIAFWRSRAERDLDRDLGA